MRKTEDSEAFSEANIDMAIHLYVLTVHSFNRSIIYVTTHERKTLIKISCSKTLKTQQVEGFTRIKIV